MVDSEYGLFFYWFTMGGEEGVYHTSTNDHGNNYAKRIMFSPHARHPQTVSLADNSIVVVWDETFKTKTSYINRIGLLVQGSEKDKPIYLTPDSVDSSYPVVLGLKNKNILVAWTQKNKEEHQVHYRLIPPEN